MGKHCVGDEETLCKMFFIGFNNENTIELDSCVPFVQNRGSRAK
jgi:hypothetical protein